MALDKKRAMIAIPTSIVIITLFLVLAFKFNIFDDSQYVSGEITNKFDNRNSTLYRTAWFEIDGKKWDAWDYIEDYEIGDQFSGRLEPWSDPLVMDDISSVVTFGFFMALVTGLIGFCFKPKEIQKRS